MSDQELCRATYIEMYRAMIAKDIPALSGVLDDSFVLVHMTGMRQPTAALIGKSRVHAAVFGGGWHTWRLEQDLKLVKKDGRWLITLSEAGTW